MPRRRYRRRKAYRRTYRRKRRTYKRRYKRRYRRKRRRRTRLAPIFSKSKVVKLRYCDQIELTPSHTTGLFFAWRFCANDLYDPDRSATGHQPYGHDEYSEFYTHYQVIGSKITARYTARSNERTAASYVIIKSGHDSTLDATDLGVTLNRENPNLNNGVTYLAPQGQPSSIAYKSASFSYKKAFNMNYDAPHLRTPLGSSPPANDQYFYHVCAACAQDNPPYPVDCDITIDYIVKLTGPKTVGTS